MLNILYIISFLRWNRTGVDGGAAAAGIVSRPEVAETVVPAGAAEDAFDVVPAQAVDAGGCGSPSLRARPRHPVR